MATYTVFKTASGEYASATDDMFKRHYRDCEKIAEGLSSLAAAFKQNELNNEPPIAQLNWL